MALLVGQNINLILMWLRHNTIIDSTHKLTGTKMDGTLQKLLIFFH